MYQGLLTQVDLRNEVSGVITLTMNVDGSCTGNHTEESSWITTCTVNEIKRQDRFKSKNAIIAGVCSCFKKPSRSVMQLLLKPIVEQLVKLEQYHLFQTASCLNHFKLIRAYLIASCSDKPANSLAQNAPEPIAKFGCTRCELPGIYVAASLKGTSISLYFDLYLGETVLSHTDEQVSKCKNLMNKSRKDIHRIRVFPNNEGVEVQMRSTVRFNHIFNQLVKVQHHNHDERNKEEMDRRLGYLGKCVLTDLSYFDHGHSFMMDTLHTIYHGTFVSICSYSKFE